MARVRLYCVAMLLVTRWPRFQTRTGTEIEMSTEGVWAWYFTGMMDIVTEALGMPPRAHMLSYLHVDLEQSARSIPLLEEHNIFSVGRREIRFIVETSVKVCYMQQQEAALSVDEKLTVFKSLLDKPGIKCADGLSLSLLPKPSRKPFLEHLDALYLESCKYVHPSPEQIRRRIDLSDDQMFEHELAAGAEGFHKLATAGLGCSLVLLLHSIAEDRAKLALRTIRERDAKILGSSGYITPSWVGNRESKP